MHHGHVAQQGHGKHFSQQMSAQQVSPELMLVEISTSHKDFGQQPVKPVSGKEDGIIFCGTLLQLQSKKEVWLRPSFQSITTCGQYFCFQISKFIITLDPRSEHTVNLRKEAFNALNYHTFVKEKREEIWQFQRQYLNNLF